MTNFCFGAASFSNLFQCYEFHMSYPASHRPFAISTRVRGKTPSRVVSEAPFSYSPNMQALTLLASMPLPRPASTRFMLLSNHSLTPATSLPLTMSSTGQHRDIQYISETFSLSLSLFPFLPSFSPPLFYDKQHHPLITLVPLTAPIDSRTDEV